jgi:DNA-binding IclR family transcriptional regulator
MEAWHVARTMRVLELLAYNPLSAPELAEALGAHPRTVRRVVAQLVAEEYLVRGDDHRRRYRPTMRLVALAGQTLSNSTVVRRARPYIALAHERTGAVAELVMPSYQSVVCVLRCNAEGEVVGPAVLEVVPAHCCAGGKVLLACLA